MRNCAPQRKKGLTSVLALTCQFAYGAVAGRLDAVSIGNSASWPGPREPTRGRLRRGAPRDHGIRASCERVPRSRRPVPTKQASKLSQHAPLSTWCSTSSARSTRGMHRPRASAALVPFGPAHRTLLASVVDASQRRSRERSIGLRDRVTRTQDREARSKPAPAARPGSSSTPPRVQGARDAPGNVVERSSGRTRCVSR